MTLQGFSSRSKQGLYRSLQGFGVSTASPSGFTPLDLCVYDGKVYVTDYFENRIVVFNTSGTYITEFGTTGTGNGEFTNPQYITTNGSHLFIVDSTRIIKHQFDGTFVASILKPASAIKRLADTADGVAVSYSKVVTTNREYAKTYDYNLSPLREAYYIKAPSDRISFLTYVDGNNFLHRTRTFSAVDSDFYILSGSATGDIGLLNSSNPNYIGEAPAYGAFTPITNNSDTIYSINGPSIDVANLVSFNTSTTSPYSVTTIGEIEVTGSSIPSFFYYDGEIYAANPDFSNPLDSMIRVYNISDGSTAREWTL